MEYISTRNSEKIYSFKDVFFKGLAPDGGLFVPKEFPLYSQKELEKLKNLSYEDLAEKIIFEFCKDQFSKEEIKNLVNISYKNFRVKDVVSIKKIGKINLLELFHGPTCAFKDFGASFLATLIEYFQQLEKQLEAQLPFVAYRHPNSDEFQCQLQQTKQASSVFPLPTSFSSRSFIPLIYNLGTLKLLTPLFLEGYCFIIFSYIALKYCDFCKSPASSNNLAFI